jgi:hypothetical protein
MLRRTIASVLNLPGIGPSSVARSPDGNATRRLTI